MVPVAKKAKTDDTKEEATDAAVEPVDGQKEQKVDESKEGDGTKEDKANDAAKEQETDAPPDNRPKVKESAAFHTDETTMNTMPSAYGNILTPLTDGGLQYLVAGARANVGVHTGRYMFEVKVLEYMNPAEDPSARNRASIPRNQVRVGFSTAGSQLFLGESEDSVCFDTDGCYVFNKKKTTISQKFGRDDVVAVVLNLDAQSPNANTVSLFKGGVRASQPQALPDELKGKTLFPTINFKNATLHYNFGPEPMAPLPFRCRMIEEAAAKDVTVTPAPAAKDGKYEVVFPVSLPDEGTFDWLDMFLEKHKNYTELSDRAILSWAEKSGLWRPKGYAAKSSNDKPEMGFGISLMDDLSIRRVLQAVAPVQHRNYVVMEVRSSLLKDERKELTSRWAMPPFKRTAMVLVGDPPQAFKRRSQELMLKQKQEAADSEFKEKKGEEKRKKLLEQRQKQLDKAKRKAERQRKKLEEEKKRKIEQERKKKEAADKGEEYKGEEDHEDGNKEEEEDNEEDEEEDIDMEEADEPPPKVELSMEEKQQVFRKTAVPDLTPYALNTSFMKFSIPDRDDGFEEVKYEWSTSDKSCKDYLKQWVQERKLTTRIEDLQPSDWFNAKWKDWQKNLQSWHARQNTYKAEVAKKASEASAKAAKRAAAKAAHEAKEKSEAEKPADEEKKEGESNENEAPEGDAEKKAEDVEMEEEEEDQEENGKVDFDNLDVFGQDDILNVGGGEPLFSQFAFEDWTMMSLRFELHLLTHAFRKDVNDPDRVGIHLEHLPFYYNKYFKKALNTKFYGVDTVKEMIHYIRDTVVINSKNQVVETMLPDDMESLGIFVMLTEEARRDRLRRIDLGEEGAKLKLSQPQVATSLQAVANRVGQVPPARPFGAVAPQIVRPVNQAWYGAQRPAASPFAASTAAAAAAAATNYRPPAAYGQTRPFQQPWRPYGRS